MNSEPTLADLARQLESNGMVVVLYKDHLQIRLSLFASVNVRVVGAGLRFEPRFGAIPRDRATWVTLVGIAALVTASFLDLGITSFTMALGFIGVSSGASTAIRYQLTENCITRVQNAWMFLTAGRLALGAPTARPELGEAQPGSARAEVHLHAEQLTDRLSSVPRGGEAKPR